LTRTLVSCGMENRQIISDNGFDDKITLIHGKVEDVDLPVPKVLFHTSHPHLLETHYVVLSCALGNSCLSCARACLHIPWCGCWFAQFPQRASKRKMRCRGRTRVSARVLCIDGEGWGAHELDLLAPVYLDLTPVCTVIDESMVTKRGQMDADSDYPSSGREAMAFRA